MVPVLIVNPRSDEAFTDLSNRLVGEGRVSTPDELERILRETHPRAVVRARELTGEPVTVWYVYREGSWVP